MTASLIGQLRQTFHRSLRGSPLCFVPDSGNQGQKIPSNADEANPTSVLIARAMAEAIGDVPNLERRVAPQTAGENFERHVCSFVEEAFKLLGHIRPGTWEVKKVDRRDRLALANNEQYAHLKTIDEYARQNPTLAAALGSDYLVSSDVIVTRKTLLDEEINKVSGPGGTGRSCSTTMAPSSIRATSPSSMLSSGTMSATMC